MKGIKLFFTALFVAAVSCAYAQNIQVKGTVYDDQGVALPGVAVKVAGSSTIVVTDIDGTYKVNAPSNGALVFEMSGYKEATVQILNKAVIDVTLNVETEVLDDVMVVAYGTVKKESFTGSASTVKKEDIVKRSVSNVSKALDGLAPGIVSTSGGGQPGSTATIQIRGFGSINASTAPLYVVDGIPYDGALNSINPADIESVSVLKDASAGALYGARGANGVIMITTKRGSKDRTQVTYRGLVGVSSRSIARYDLVGQNEFVELTWEALKNGYQYNSGYSEAKAKAQASADLGKNLGGQFYNPWKNKTWETLIDPNTGKIVSDAVSAWDENWMDEITNNAAFRTEHTLAVSGGNDKTQFLMSLGYLYENGVLKKTHFDRYSGKVSVDHQAKFWLKAGLSANMSYTESNQPNLSSGSYTSNAWYTAQFMSPIYPMYLKDDAGNDLLDEAGNRQLDYGDGAVTRPKASKFNSLGIAQDDFYKYQRDNLSFRTNIDLGGDSEKMGVLKGLKLQVNFGGDFVNQNVTSYYNPYHGDGASQGGEINKYNTRDFSYTFNQLLSYNRAFGKHKFDVLLGHEYYDYTYNYLYGSKTGVYPGIYELAPATTVSGTNSYQNDQTVESLLSRVNYSYDDKYYFSASFRRDGSSRFHKDNRWGNFWSVGASWRLTQEEFLQNVSWLNNLTLKASYGTTGNDNIGLYAWQSFYDLTYPNAGARGAVITSLENKSVTWEKTGKFNLGVDATMFDSRLNASIEFYYNKVSDMLLSYPMAMSTGFSGYNANVGSMRNRGLEVSIKGVIFNNTNLYWDLGVMGAFNQNKVLSLTEESNQIVSGSQIIKEGFPLYTWYMSKQAGVDPATGKQLYYAYESMDDNGNVTGEYITEDYTVASKCKYFQGSRQPKFNGSISTSLRIFKNIDLSILATYSLGGKVYESNYAQTMEPMYVGDALNRNLLRRWQKPGDVTDVPMIEFSGATANTNRWLIDASYLAIKNITVGYSMPRKWADKINVQNIRLYANLDNIAMFCHLDGMDPQYSLSGGTDYTYAPVKTMSLGLEINF